MAEHQVDKQSAIYKHVQILNHEIDWEEVEAASNEVKLALKELIYINKHEPTLNVQRS